MSLSTMPPEIMLMILHPSNYIRRPGLYPILPQREALRGYSNLRLVSKEFSAHITPHLFKNITVGSRECSLKRLERIAESNEIQTWVKRYIYVLAPNNPLERSTSRSVYDDYLRLLADPACAEKLATIDTSTDPQSIKIARWLEQREFDLSNDLHDVHVKCLSSLPVLRSIQLTSPAWYGLSDQSHAMNHPGASGNKSWGPTVFRAILLAMYNRIQTNASPIEEFVLKGVTEECMLLPPHFFQKAILGFQNIKTLVISIQNYHDHPEVMTGPGWINLLGRLMQSATSLESLEIEVPDSMGIVQFSTLASPFKYKSAGETESTSAEKCWPKLKSLKLRDIIFSETHILQFLSSHKKSLRTIHFDNCAIQKSDSSDNSQSESAYESPPASDEETVAPRPWTLVLRQIAKSFPPRTVSALVSFKVEQLRYKNCGMPRCRIELWQDYIGGIIDTEPAEDHRDDSCGCMSDDSDSSMAGSEVGFWTMHGMHAMHGMDGVDPFDFWSEGEEEEDEEEFDEENEEDIDLGEGFFIHPPGLHPYPWEWPQAGYQEY